MLVRGVGCDVGGDEEPHCVVGEGGELDSDCDFDFDIDFDFDCDTDTDIDFDCDCDCDCDFDTDTDLDLDLDGAPRHYLFSHPVRPRRTSLWHQLLRNPHVR